ncbi:hypothetical protein GIB67_030867, partial [Kingdonia uniflora]
IVVSSYDCECNGLYQFRGEWITVGVDDEDSKHRWASRDLAEHLSCLAIFGCLFSAEASLRSSVT